MHYVRVAIGLGMLLALVSPGTVASAQDSTAPQKLPLTIFEQAQPIVPPDAVSRDTLKNLPPPKPDRLSDVVTGTVVIDGPQCLPGEPGFVGPDPMRLPGRRRR